MSEDFTSDLVKKCRQPVKDYDRVWKSLNAVGFNVGDTVIKVNYKNQPILKYGAPIKYKVVEVSPSGLVFGKQILSKNSLGEPRVLNFHDRIMLDPDLTIRILTGSEDGYDPSVNIAANKKERDRLIRINKKNAINSTDPNAHVVIKEKVLALEVGDKIWLGHYSTNFCEYKVVEKYGANTSTVYGQVTENGIVQDAIVLKNTSYQHSSPYPFSMRNITRYKYVSFVKPLPLPGEK